MRHLLLDIITSCVRSLLMNVDATCPIDSTNFKLNCFILLVLFSYLLKVVCKSSSWVGNRDGVILAESDDLCLACGGFLSPLGRARLRQAFAQLLLLRLHNVDQLKHKAELAVDCSVGRKKLLNFERWGKLKDSCENAKHVLHERVVILRNQVCVSVLPDEVCHLL